MAKVIDYVQQLITPIDVTIPAGVLFSPGFETAGTTLVAAIIKQNLAAATTLTFDASFEGPDDVSGFTPLVDAVGNLFGQTISGNTAFGLNPATMFGFRSFRLRLNVVEASDVLIRVTCRAV